MPKAQPAPNITLGKSVAAATVARSVGQGVTGSFVVEGITAFNLYTFTPRQQGWATIAAGIIICWIQNWLEARRGQKFIGAAPEAATKRSKP